MTENKVFLHICRHNVFVFVISAPVAADNGFGGAFTMTSLPEDTTNESDNDDNMLKTNSNLKRATASKHRQRITRSQSFFKKLLKRHEEAPPSEEKIEE